MNEARNAIDLIIHAPEKVAEGYNNFFFGDDAYKNVKNLINEENQSKNKGKELTQ